jgi:hypothetical protein
MAASPFICSWGKYFGNLAMFASVPLQYMYNFIITSFQFGTVASIHILQTRKQI